MKFFLGSSDEIVYFHLNEMNEIAREKSCWWMIFHTALSYPYVSDEGKNISFINEKKKKKRQLREGRKVFDLYLRS